MPKPVIFISHVSEEADLAKILKRTIEGDFLQMVKVFVSSDTASIQAGQNWLDSVGEALRLASAEIILCSKTSLSRPWINFEAGAGWMRKIPIVPVCHSGLKPRDLPMPLSVLQGIVASEIDGLDRLYVQIATTVDCAKPKASLNALAEAVRKFEDAYLPKIAKQSDARASRETLALERMKQALGEGDYVWRSIDRLSVKGGVSEAEATEILRTDPEIVFGRAKSHRMIARLQSRPPKTTDKSDV